MSQREEKETKAMRTFAYKRSVGLIALVIVASGLVLTASPASADPVTIDLCAMAGPSDLGSVTVEVWGFALLDGASDCSTVAPRLPGPVLEVNEGDTVTINITNALPTATGPNDHAISFEIPGVMFDSGPTTAAVGGSVTISFTATAPGTYLYQSGGDAGRQEAMGLYGALIVRPSSVNQAYDDPVTAFDAEATLVLSAVDAGFNADPDGFDMKNYLATYWLINGKTFDPAAPSSISAPAGQRLLIRYVNAGFDNTTMALLGAHERVIARDAHLLTNPFDANAETIPAGGTEDAIVTVPATDPPSVNGFPLYNRQLHVTNGATTDGGMMTFIVP